MTWESALSNLFNILVYPGFIFFIALSLFYQWVDRRFYARVQNRFGPIYTGPAGILQPLADFIKLLSKEDIEPMAADKHIFRAVPIMILALPLTAVLILPVMGAQSIIHFEGDLIFIIFIMTLVAMLAFLGGWASTNMFSTLGGVRAALQTLGYEVPMAISFMGPAILAKSLSISKIVMWQYTSGVWAVLLNPIGFGIVIVAFLAELERIPFDIPEAETEIVAGWQTEFSGRKLALIRLAFDLELVLSSGLAAALFLGGPTGPILPGVFWFIIKTLILVLIISGLRALFARFRIDQMVSGCWRYLVPLSIIQIIILEFTLGWG
ncbi:MAG: complex I subunit 1/NuoH family protein [Candidatus Bathyarchaeia archaeon]